jgi:hypothetical protein
MPRSTILLSCLLALAAFCSGQDEIQLEGSLVLSAYPGGYLLDWNYPDHQNPITVYGPDAKPIYTFSNCQLCIWTIDADGVAARSYHTDPYQGHIDILDTSGGVDRTINTGLYEAQHLVFAPDHTLWTVGFVLGYEELADDFNVVRHYSRAGEELTEAIPWRSIQGDHNAYTALPAVLGGRRLFAASDRIGFLSSANDGQSKWIEVSFAGVLLGQYDLGHYYDLNFAPMAMTASGGVYGAIYQGHTSFEGYGVLDKSDRMWHKVPNAPKARLIGADGDTLVFSQKKDGRTVLQKMGG